ncbi:uncharacterized protein PAC_04602 [Phialocephala subalpina]|uniref:Uncharacterized protein n=1 Tax=Phialocephala subalpina TaxID=576137 RepID=A0A1L7WPM2_9HELO|nr:uncharacterized protein PAC_04602 [Phialocephala subalpina]
MATGVGSTERERRRQASMGSRVRDIEEEKLVLLGSAFDADSLGRWVYDWVVCWCGAGTPMTEVAGELWLLLINLYRKCRRAEQMAQSVEGDENRETVQEFLEGGDRLKDRLRKLLKACEKPMLKCERSGLDGKLGKEAGRAFVDFFFGRDELLESVEEYIALVRLWSWRFDVNCEELLRSSSGEERRGKYGLAERVCGCYGDIMQDMTWKLEILVMISQRESQSFSADDLSDSLKRLDAFETRLLLQTRFSEVATKEYAWIAELSKLGYSPGEISDELLEKSLQGPWIHGDFQAPLAEPFQRGFHLAGCLHRNPTTARDTTHAKDHGTIMNPPTVIESTCSQLSIRESVEFLCGLGGVRPAADEPEAVELGCISFEDQSTTAIISPKFPRHLHIAEILQGILKNLEGAACILQQAGGCCDSFTFLALRESHVELHKIDLALLRQFAEMLGTKENIEKKYVFDEIWRHIFPWVQSDSLTFNYVDAEVDGFPFAWCPAVQFISVALLSYAQAHAGPIRPFFLDTAQERVVITNCNNSKSAAGYPCIVGSLVELTCMGDMTGQSVFVFQYQQRYDEIAVRDASTRKYDLVASPEDLLDTWGPGEFIADVNDPSRLFAISLGGGSITAVEAQGKTMLHWTREPLSNKHPSIAFERSSKIKIGARVLENSRCQADTKKQMSDAVALLEELGTFPSYWEVRERQLGFGIQGGQAAMAAFQFNQTWVKMRGSTKKSTLLVQHAVYTADLDSLFGVQVSVCTGIARRVQLRDLLADILPAYVGGLVTTPRLWKSLNEDLKIIEALQGPDLRMWLSKLDHDHQQAFESLVIAVLFLLRDTGVDRKGQNFVIARIQPDLPFQCFKVPCRKESYWARMLADSEEIATFSYITTQCLETAQVKCRGPGASWTNTTGLLMTAVSCYQERVATLPSSSSSSSTQWVLKHSEAYLIGRPDAPLFVQVDRPDNNDEPRLLVSPSKIPSEYLYRLYRKWKPGKPRRLREKKASDRFAESVIVLMR